MAEGRGGTRTADEQKSLPSLQVEGVVNKGLIEISQGIQVTGSDIDEGNTGWRSDADRAFLANKA